ncbi:MAG: dioxygenase [Rhodospirillaceae bacterium]|nr:dioxygenase [Rhodospirillaceae bacterium]
MRLPTVYVTHGSPTLIIDDCPARDFLRGLGAQLPRPKAVLCVSAHWEQPRAAVSAAPKPPTIHDFVGFPRELYAMRHEAPGAPSIAGRAAGLLHKAGISCVVDPLRGFDHGAWVPLKLMYPEADVPAFQLSIQTRLGAAHHVALGRALAPLRDEGVLILGSGSATHNLRDFRGASGLADPPRPYVKPFDDWLVKTVEAGDEKALVEWERAPEARRNHPTDDHWLPIYVPFGAALATGDGKGRTLHRSVTYGIIAMTAFAWG